MIGRARRFALLTLVTTSCSAALDTLPDGGDASVAEVDGGANVCGAADDIDRYGPELEGCEVHRGSIFIEGYLEGLPDLALLHALREIRGSFTLSLCFDLTSLHGLERLERTLSFAISQVPELEDLSELSALQSASEGILLSDLDGLLSVRGADRLESIGALHLHKLHKLEDLDGFPNLRTLGELSITDNAALRSLSGFAQLQKIDGRLDITRNPRLPRAAIDAFLARIEVTGEVTIAGNAP